MLHLVELRPPLIIAILLTAGCTAPIEEDPRPKLAEFEGCDWTFPSGAQGICEDMSSPSIDGAPDQLVTCHTGHAGQGWWHAVIVDVQNDRLGFWSILDDGLEGVFVAKKGPEEHLFYHPAGSWHSWMPPGWNTDIDTDSRIFDTNLTLRVQGENVAVKQLWGPHGDLPAVAYRADLEGTAFYFHNVTVARIIESTFEMTHYPFAINGSDFHFQVVRWELESRGWYIGSVPVPFYHGRPCELERSR